MKIQKRIIVVLAFIMIMIITLVGRLVQLQLVSTESFTEKGINLIEKSVAQRTHTIVIDDGRGRFVDRNGEALSEDFYPNLILFPFLKNMNWPAEKVARILNIKKDDLLAQVAAAKAPFPYGDDKPIRLTQTQMEKINALQIPGVVAAKAQTKIQQPIAEHFIGIAAQNPGQVKERYPDKLKEGKVSDTTTIGITGLQEAFDEFLLTDGEAKLLYHVDRQGEPIFGKNVKYTQPANPFYPVVIKTTLDKELQTIAEDLVNKYNMKKGGLVLLDVKTSEILAMVSKPSITAEDATWKNQMLLSQFPGSVFKTVVAAAAIDNGLIQEGRTFNCDSDLYGTGQAEHPMGTLNFEQSFARSCNRTFAVLGQELLAKDKGMIEKYAGMLGLTDTVGWQGRVFHFPSFVQLPDEEKGVIWGEEKDKGVQKAIAQTSVGQKNVRMTPLAIANMMATIARGGEKLKVKAVKEIDYKNGTKLYRFPNQELKGDNLASETITKLQQLLRSVVTTPNGTGAVFQGLPYNVAGKSGTAEGIKGQGVNKWFAGYFPYENPKYALVVVDLETTSPESLSKSIYADYVKAVYDLDQAKRKQVYNREGM
jgi:cell division protein FtsI/penicillin-binding protein 2